jgi:hypothetical protein
MTRIRDLCLLLAGCLCLLSTLIDHSEIEWITSLDATIKPFTPVALNSVGIDPMSTSLIIS